MFLVRPQITGSFLNDGGGLLGADEYHMAKVCQAGSISSRDMIVRGLSPVSQGLFEVQISSILASPLRFLRLLDNLIRPEQHRLRNREADLLGGL